MSVIKAAELKEILRTEYGINDEREFNEAVNKVPGVNLGIFTIPLVEKYENGEEGGACKCAVYA